jgi:hypothetical protein
MATKEKATVVAEPLRGKGKGMHFSRTTIEVKQIFLSGRKVTAKEINAETGLNDARKCISLLRRGGMNIRDTRMSNRCKLYWWETEKQQQPTFFDHERD